jgi:23S rRNA (cytidine1920-2'-O)/16S rRNA (cytidine1409-2'-O)-methyltransferase
MSKNMRIDQLLRQRQLVESRSEAQRLIMAGRIRVDGQLVIKSSKMVSPEAELTVEPGPRYVSRGGEKLAAAIKAFDLGVNGRLCADVGASTGGFTDCLLQHGAARVYAIDVGKGQLHWQLRNDPRVVVIESTNARYLDQLETEVHLVTIDVSFISLRHILPPASRWLIEEGEVVALVKPQFEAGRGKVGKGGVVRDMGIHRQVLENVILIAEDAELFPAGLLPSPLLGPKGNREFLLWLVRDDPAIPRGSMIESALMASPGQLS